MDTSHASTPAPPMWRLRAELRDRPGALARLTASLAALDCNILALTVLPVPDAAVQPTTTCVSPRVPPTPVGALGSAAGVTGDDAAESRLSPTLLVAVAVNVYAVPLVRPVTVHVVAPVVEHVAVPGVAVTV